MTTKAVATTDGAPRRAASGLILAGPALALLLPPWPALAALIVCLALWARRPTVRRRQAGHLAALALLAVAIAALAGSLFGSVRPVTPERLAASVVSRLETEWTELEAAARRAAATLRVPGSFPLSRLEAFATLADQIPGSEADLALVLLDPDGTAEAWAGRGLLHEVEGLRSSTESRRAFRAGVHAVTLAVVRPLEEGARPWRVVAARSLSTETLPPPLDRLGRLHWTLFAPGEAVSPELLALGPAGDSSSPRVAVLEADLRAVADGRPPSSRTARRLAELLVGLALLIEALLALGWTAATDASPARPALAVAAGLGAALALASSADTPAGTLVVMLLTGSFCGLSWLRKPTRRPAPWRWAVAGLGAAWGAAALSRGVQLAAPLDLGTEVAVPLEAVAARLVPFLWVAGCLAWAAGTDRSTSRDAGRRLALAVAVTLLAAAALDRAWLSLALLGLAGLAVGWWAATADLRGELRAVGALALAGAILSAAAWESAFRRSYLAFVADVALPAVVPPTAGELDRLTEAFERGLDGLELREVTLRDPSVLDAQDLALAVWRHSPLCERGFLSALVVESWDGASSSFSFGLPLTEEGELDRSTARGPQIPDAVYRESLVEGGGELVLDGAPWGTVRFWALARPGYRLEAGPVEELAEGLLRGGPAALQPERGLIGAAGYLAFDASGEPLTPIDAGAPRSADLDPGARTSIRLDDGREAWVWAARGEGWLRGLVVPRLGGPAALERVGTHALGLLALLSGVGLLALLVRARRAVIASRQALGHYSKRLIVVYSLFLLLPVLALNAVVVRILSERLEGEQRASGRLALESASRILGEYVLTLDPGFGIGTTLDDELMVWLSRVVRHEMNLYWGSAVYASSRRELFTAGLLPERIPGEIYSRLALRDSAVASRTNRAGGTPYLELYGRVAVPGVALGEPRLVLSLPLLAQEEELAAEIASLRRRAMLLTAAVALVLAAVGARLARSFTRPLMEVVRGTQRIAAGASSIDVHPSEQELATLVRAIDDMARRIADSRYELLREKAVVERMIDHITSGVVSVDRDRRVLMTNRVAQRLLHLGVGDTLDRLAAGEPRLAPLARALEEAMADGAPRTVRLPGEGDDEREWTLVWVPLPGEGEPSALLVVEDVTEVLRGQRLQAWAEMARIIAHEIKNPLTPIRLSTEHMREVRKRDPEHFDAVFERCTRNILRQVSELQIISGEFLTYSRIPRCEPQPGDLVRLAHEIVEPYRAAPPPGIEVELAGADGELPAEFDARLLGRALRNLIENAVRATSGGGRVRVSVQRQGDTARLVVEDDGPGVAPADLTRIFEPYFSTHDTGTGLGLPIAQRIAAEHGGGVQARNRPQGGLEVSISIPVGGRARAETAQTLR